MRRFGNAFDGFLSRYNFTDFHELNLDWLIVKMIELNEIVENFVSLNAIKYADPIQWNIASQYEKNTVVIDPQTGTAYLSVAPVPSGVAITNPDYWTVIFDLDIAQANNNITLRDDGNNVLSTFTSDVGDWLLWNGTLYRVTQTIGLSQAYVIGYNIERYTVEEFVTGYVNNILSQIGDLNSLSTSVKTDLVSAINELFTVADTMAYVATKNFNDIQDAVEYAHDNNISIIVQTEDRIISTPICLYDGMTFDGCGHEISTISTYSSPRIITNYDSFITNNNAYQKFNSDSTANRNYNITVKNVVIAADWTQSFDGMVNPYPRGPIAFDSVDGVTVVNVTNKKLQDEITVWCTRCNDLEVYDCNIESTLTVAGGCIWVFGDSISGANTYSNFNIHDCILKCAKDEAVYFSATYGSIENINVHHCKITGDQLAVSVIGLSNNIDIHDNVVNGGYIKLGNNINNTRVHDNLITGNSSTYLGIFTQPQNTNIKGVNVEVSNNIFNIGASVAGSAVSLRYFSSVNISDNIIEMLNTTYQTIDLRNTEKIKVSDNKIKGVRFAYIEGSNTKPTIISGNVFESIDNTRSALEFGAGALAFVKVMNNKFYDAGACIANEGGNFEGNFFIGNTCNNCTCLFSLNALLSATALSNKSIMKDNLVESGALYIDTLGSGTIANDSRIVKFNNYVYVPDGTSTPTWTLTT